MNAREHAQPFQREMLFRQVGPLTGGVLLVLLSLAVPHATHHGTTLLVQAASLIGITIVALMPRCLHVAATPCAWLPALAVTTPFFFACAMFSRMQFEAPRILKLPVRCRFSHLSEMSLPHFVLR